MIFLFSLLFENAMASRKQHIEESGIWVVQQALSVLEPSCCALVLHASFSYSCDANLDYMYNKVHKSIFPPPGSCGII